MCLWTLHREPLFSSWCAENTHVWYGKLECRVRNGVGGGVVVRGGVGGVAMIHEAENFKRLWPWQRHFVLRPRYTIRWWLGWQIAKFVTGLAQSSTQPIDQWGIPLTTGTYHWSMRFISEWDGTHLFTRVCYMPACNCKLGRKWYGFHISNHKSMLHLTCIAWSQYANI